MTDHDEALRLLREAFPESEGWIAYCEPFISSSRATVLTPCIRISYERKTCMDAARAVISARDQLVADAVAKERERCRALVSEAARMCEEAGDTKVVRTLQVVALAIVTSGAVRDAHDALRGGS